MGSKITTLTPIASRAIVNCGFSLFQSLSFGLVVVGGRNKNVIHSLFTKICYKLALFSYVHRRSILNNTLLRIESLHAVYNARRGNQRGIMLYIGLCVGNLLSSSVQNVYHHPEKIQCLLSTTLCLKLMDMLCDKHEKRCIIILGFL